MKKCHMMFFLTLFLIGTDTFIISPLLPELRGIFHVSKQISSWMVTAYAFGYALFALVAGPLSDGLNRRPVMILGMISFAVTAFLCGLAPSFGWMLVFRFFAGISAAFTAPQVWAAIATLFPAASLVRAMGIATAGLAISQALGVPIGSWLAIWNWSDPFYAIGISALLVSLFLWRYLPDLKPIANERPSILQRYRSLLRKPAAKKTFLAYFIFQTGNYAGFTLLGTWLSDRFSLTNGGIAWVMVCLGAGNTIGSFFGTSVVKRLGTLRALGIGIPALAILYFMVPFSTSPNSVKIGYFILFAITGTLFPVMMTLLTSLSASLRGTISSLASSTMYAAATIGSMLGGLLYVKGIGFISVCIFTSVCCLISAVLFRWSQSTTAESNLQRDLIEVESVL